MARCESIVGERRFTAEIRQSDGHLVLTYIDPGHEDEPHVFVVAKEDIKAVHRLLGDPVED